MMMMVICDIKMVAAEIDVNCRTCLPPKPATFPHHYHHHHHHHGKEKDDEDRLMMILEPVLQDRGHWQAGTFFRTDWIRGCTSASTIFSQSPHFSRKPPNWHFLTSWNHASHTTFPYIANGNAYVTFKKKHINVQVN